MEVLRWVKVILFEEIFQFDKGQDKALYAFIFKEFTQRFVKWSLTS
jgi:hypothetical protein